MKTNKNTSKLALKKLPIAKINNLSMINGGHGKVNVFITPSRSYRPTCWLLNKE
ncbi:hypothetical protein [Aquimarina sp. AU474]|uniref:hypothetical protein n=1 Tax=Aquimarina sp. AU474 TaxID=2108529 RepID=UPI001359B0BF|nr:hypothetical protein [Aquimarina sp. AU474]